MPISKTSCLMLISLGSICLGNQELSFGQDSEPVSSRILKWSETEQISWLKSYLADGAPSGDALPMLVFNRGAVALPVLEKEIEVILRSPSPRKLFNDLSIDPQRVIVVATSMITYAGSELSLREESKLIKIDEQRFGDLVEETLFSALTMGNPYTLAYRGLEIGDPAVDKRIIDWIGKRFIPTEEYMRAIARRSWAEAMVAKYEGEPTAVQWTNDPIASRLKSAGDPLFHDEMRPFLERAAKARMKK